MSEPPRSIERSQLVALSVEDSFAFFADAYNLEALTPSRTVLKRLSVARALLFWPPSNGDARMPRCSKGD